MAIIRVQYWKDLEPDYKGLAEKKWPFKLDKEGLRTRVRYYINGKKYVPLMIAYYPNEFTMIGDAGLGWFSMKNCWTVIYDKIKDIADVDTLGYILSKMLGGR